MRPAATITDGFDVLVQLVIAAMTTDACLKTCSASSILTLVLWGRGGVSPVWPASPSHRPIGAGPADVTAATGGATGFVSVGSGSANVPRASPRLTRSCGRR